MVLKEFLLLAALALVSLPTTVQQGESLDIFIHVCVY